MLIVETIAKIRRAHLVQGKSIKAIARELRVPRDNQGENSATIRMRDGRRRVRAARA
jgi:uncharacterized protein YoaH (UPF0181 family)